MPSGRMPRAGHNLELPLGPLCALPRAVHSSGPGRGEPPPPALPQMRYACFLEVVEWDTLATDMFDKV